MSTFRDQLQFTVEEGRLLSPEEGAALDLADFMPASPYPLDAMMDELMGLIREEFRYKPWRKLVDGVFKNEELREAFRTCPAAKGVHHAYAGGLLEHTLSVFKLCRRLADQYPELDRQTPAGRGPVPRLRQDPRIFRRHRQRLYRRGPPAGASGNLRGDAGSLSGKIGPGAELQRHLKHLVLSHHGTLEFGAVRVPQTAEALVLHYADNIDAKMAQCGACSPAGRRRELDALSGHPGPGHAPLRADAGGRKSRKEAPRFPEVFRGGRDALPAVRLPCSSLSKA